MSDDPTTLHTLRFTVTGENWGEIEIAAERQARAYFCIAHRGRNWEPREQVLNNAQFTVRPLIVSGAGEVLMWTADVEVSR